MMFALSPEHAQELATVLEVAQAAHTAGTFDSEWWLNNEAHFSNHAEESEPNHKSTSESPTAAAAEDIKPSATKSPENPQTACGYRRNNCRPNHRHATFQHCRRWNQAARRQRQAAMQKVANGFRTVEQRTPIHMHEETSDAAKMSLDVTGFSPSDITIHIDNYVVSIQGERTNKLGDIFVVDRRFRLDKNTASVDQVTANFEDGILELTVPKKAVAGPRKIPIAVSGSVVSAETEATKEDNEVSQASVLTLSVDSTEGVEDLQSTEETNPKEEQEQTQDTITVETVREDKATIEEDHDTVAASNSVEEETWEEVSN
jgi:HSP20 family molecular chaperone IbpA